MGDSEEGGGGSVRWKLEVDDAKSANHNHTGNKVKQGGEDDDGEVGTDFTVSVQVPRGMTGPAFLAHLQGMLTLNSSGSRVFFNHPIEENRPAQIRVSWGDSSHHEGTGGKRSLRLGKKKRAAKRR